MLILADCTLKKSLGSCALMHQEVNLPIADCVVHAHLNRSSCGNCWYNLKVNIFQSGYHGLVFTGAVKWAKGSQSKSVLSVRKPRATNQGLTHNQDLMACTA